MQSHPVDAHLARDQLNVASPSTSITDLFWFGLLYRVIEVVQVPQLQVPQLRVPQPQVTQPQVPLLQVPLLQEALG